MGIRWRPVPPAVDFLAAVPVVARRPRCLQFVGVPGPLSVVSHESRTSILVVCPGCSAKLNAPESRRQESEVPEVPDGGPRPVTGRRGRGGRAGTRTAAQPKRPARAAPRPARKADADDENDRPRKRRRADDEADEDQPWRRSRKWTTRMRRARTTARGSSRKKVLKGRGSAAGAAVRRDRGSRPGRWVRGVLVRVPRRNGRRHRLASGTGWSRRTGRSGSACCSSARGLEAVRLRVGLVQGAFLAEPKTSATIKSSRSIGGVSRTTAPTSTGPTRAGRTWPALCACSSFPRPARRNSSRRSRTRFAPPRPRRGKPPPAGARPRWAAGGEGGRRGDHTPRDRHQPEDHPGRPTDAVETRNRQPLDRTNNKCYHPQGGGTQHAAEGCGRVLRQLHTHHLPALQDGGGTPEPKEPPKPITVPAGRVAYQPVGVGFKTVMPIDIKVTDATTKLPSKRGKPMLQSVKLYRGIDAEGVVCEARGAVLLGGGEHGRPVERDQRGRRAGVREARAAASGSKSVTWAGKPPRERTSGASRAWPARRTPGDRRPRRRGLRPEREARPGEGAGLLDSFEFTE